MGFEQIVGLATSNLPEVLVASDKIRDIDHIVARFPVDIANFFGFETYLHKENDSVGFAFNLRNNGLVWLSRQTNLWPFIAKFCSLWGNSCSPIFSNGNTVWLEFDVCDDSIEIPVPSIFFAYLEPHKIIAASDESESSLAWHCRHLISVLRGRKIPSHVEANIINCASKLPPDIYRLQIGLMLGRDIDAIRMCSFGFSAEEVMPYLEDIGWSGNKSLVSSFLERYAPFVDTLCVHLDIEDTIYPSLGVELIFSGDNPDYWQPDLEPRWMKLFDCLVEDGYCQDVKRTALLAWPNRISWNLPLIEKLIGAASMPDDLNRKQILQDGNLNMGLQHIKTSFALDGTMQTKAYFGARYEFG